TRPIASLAFHYSLTPIVVLFLFIAPAPTEIYTLSLHDALPISSESCSVADSARVISAPASRSTMMPDWSIKISFPAAVALVKARSEEHTSELQSRENLVCRLLLEKKKTLVFRQQTEDSSVVEVI